VKISDPVVFAGRRRSILEYARHLFATKGFAETTVDDIAHACQMQKASLYHYFEGKQQILQEMVNLECGRWLSHLKDYEKGESLRETLELIAQSFLRDMEEPGCREFFKIIHFESHKNPAILQAMKATPAYNREGFYAVFARHLENRLPKIKIGMFMTQFMGSLIHYVTSAKLRGENCCFESYEDKAYVEQLVNTFARGIEHEGH
jgi:AcrR family transcriptional regulator